jgi:hypothetical protein
LTSPEATTAAVLLLLVTLAGGISSLFFLKEEIFSLFSSSEGLKLEKSVDSHRSKK